jgi:hypothetical protein
MLASKSSVQEVVPPRQTRHKRNVRTANSGLLDAPAAVLCVPRRQLCAAAGLTEEARYATKYNVVSGAESREWSGARQV